MDNTPLPEPWLRGTLTDVPPTQRAVLHALELAQEDLHRWCSSLNDEELNASPEGIAPVAFHLRHIARSIDRLLTYAEGRQLAPEQIALLKSELAPGTPRNELFTELRSALAVGAARIRFFKANQIDEPRSVEESNANYGGRTAGPCGRPHATSRGSGDNNGKDRDGKAHQQTAMNEHGLHPPSATFFLLENRREKENV